MLHFPPEGPVRVPVVSAQLQEHFFSTQLDVPGHVADAPVATAFIDSLELQGYVLG